MKQWDFHELWQFIPYAIGLCYFSCLSTTISNIAASICMPQIVWNSVMFLLSFGPLIPGTKIHNVVKVVKESGRDAKFRKHEEHYLSGILLAPSSFLCFVIPLMSSGLLDFHSLYQQYWGVCDAYICRHIVEFDSLNACASAHALRIRDLMIQQLCSIWRGRSQTHCDKVKNIAKEQGSAEVIQY